MIESAVSGICFTVHPVTKDKHQMIIEAGWGLGEAIVSGQITPDTYIIDKRNFTLDHLTVSEQEKMIVRARAGKEVGANKVVAVPPSKRRKQKLTRSQIIKLAKLCARIEEHYGIPQDIEWALAGDKLYILQSRPITTL